MSTTLVTNIEGNGVGVMGQALARHIQSITGVIAVRCSPGWSCDLDFPSRCKVVISEINPPDPCLLNQFNDRRLWPSIPRNQKLIYIESSCGLSQHAAEFQTIHVPMWEQGSVPLELDNSSINIAISYHTQRYLFERWHKGSQYLPFPVEVPPTWSPVSLVRTILHNAGSFGGNLRKGTLEAIRIFQHSGVAAHGVKLLIRSWVAPTHEVMAAIEEDPHGIDLVCQFQTNIDAIYHRVDLLLHPSKIDGSPLIPVEAMARGIPTLITDSAPINECEDDPDFLLPVSHNMPSPLAAPYDIVDVEQGAEKLRRLCERDLGQKSRAVRSLVEKERSWEVLGPVWEDICA